MTLGQLKRGPGNVRVHTHLVHIQGASPFQRLTTAFPGNTSQTNDQITVGTRRTTPTRTPTEPALTNPWFAPPVNRYATPNNAPNMNIADPTSPNITWSTSHQAERPMS